MEGDFSRVRFDPSQHYSGVLMQQGRVQLDADWNEQWGLQTQSLRSALRDLIGRHGGPDGDLGFGVTPSGGSNARVVTVGTGVYYVDGIRCEERKPTTLSLPNAGEATYLVFLEVWERHVSAVEDTEVREVALLGPDTTTRAQVRWSPRLMRLGVSGGNAAEASEAADAIVGELRRDMDARLRLAARAYTPSSVDDPCELPPASQYRGRENQLYRVEIHRGLGPITPTNPDVVPAPRPPRPPRPQPIRPIDRAIEAPGLFTFKWSRDNGSVVFPILPAEVPGLDGGVRVGDDATTVIVTLAHLGRDARFGLQAGDIVEFVDDELSTGQRDRDVVLEQGALEPGVHGVLAEVTAVDVDTREVTLRALGGDTVTVAEAALHPYLRRWDQRAVEGRSLESGAVPVHESDLGVTWFPLEDGVEVRFERRDASDNPARPTLRARDFWWIPARAATGAVLWPTDADTDGNETAAFLPPHGVRRHYAPLAAVRCDGASIAAVVGTRLPFLTLTDGVTRR